MATYRKLRRCYLNKHDSGFDTSCLQIVKRIHPKYADWRSEIAISTQDYPRFLCVEIYITAVPTKLTVSCWGIVAYSFAYSVRVHRAICKFSLHGISIHDDTTEGSHMSKHTRKNASKYRVKCYLVQNVVYNGIRPFLEGQPSGIVSDISLPRGFVTIRYPRAAPEGRV